MIPSADVNTIEIILNTSPFVVFTYIIIYTTKYIDATICNAGYARTFNPNVILYLHREQMIIEAKTVLIIVLSNLNININRASNCFSSGNQQYSLCFPVCPSAAKVTANTIERTLKTITSTITVVFDNLTSSPSFFALW